MTQTVDRLDAACFWVVRGTDADKEHHPTPGHARAAHRHARWVSFKLGMQLLVAYRFREGLAHIDDALDLARPLATGYCWATSPTCCRCSVVAPTREHYPTEETAAAAAVAHCGICGHARPASDDTAA